MTDRPTIGTMVRCKGPKFDAGAVTYNGHSRIDLPHRTEAGKVVRGTVDSYQLKQVGKEWIYELISDASREDASREVEKARPVNRL